MSRKLNSFLFVLVAASLLLAACAAPAASAGTSTQTTQPAQLAPGSVQINGAGATFPVPVYTEWTFAYQYVDPSVTINYQGIGSGGGKKAIIDGTVDFAGSDSLVTADEYTAGKDLQMYPMIAGSVVVIYNIDGLAADAPALVLDRPTLVGIYNGTINKWNDPAITTLNPDLASSLPDKAITAVHRSDGSGTTEIFTNALKSFSAGWTAGSGSSVEWPVDKAGNGVGGKGNQGVAAAVQNTPNSLGYVELSYAVQNKITYASLVNKAGKTVVADAASTQSAMSDFADKFTDQLTAIIVDGSGDGSYPIAGYTYLVLHTTSMTDCVKAQKLLEYIKWSVTDASAAKRAADLGYSVLPPAVQQKVLGKLAEVTCSGQPVLK
jgi:phosphate transport system substrate-binding protein